MALVNPNIAMGYQGIQLPNQLAQYSQIEQIKNAQQANQLNQLRMEEYQLEKQNKNALSQAYAQSFDPTSGKLDYNKLTGLLAQGGQAAQIPGLLKQRTEEERAATEEAARRAKLMQDTQAMYRDLSSQIGSKQDAVAFLKTVVNDPAMKDSPLARIPLMQQIQRIPDDPQGLDNWIKQFSLGATKYFTENKPVTFAQDTGAGGRLMSRPGLGGAATVVPGSEFTKTATIGERTAQANLNLAREKFAFEQANPGFELKEGEDGTFYGVNKRTLQAVPVTIGAAATAPVAPTPSRPNALGPRVPMPTSQAIPGMTSVLDQQATPAMPVAAPVSTMPVAGAPLRGKGNEKPLTETQSNATAYGMRMKEANSILEDLAKQGVLKGAIVERTPLVGGVLGKVLPSFMGGTSEQQQQVNQAKSNFITAVLRKESGAVISDSEFEREDQKYFPQINDSEAVIKQKANARKLAIKAIEVQAGPGAKIIQQLQPSGGVPNSSANNPLGLPGL